MQNEANKMNSKWNHQDRSPRVDVLFGEHKSSQEEEQEQNQGAQCIGNDNVACKGPDSTEQGDCAVVHQETQQPEHEHPAWRGESRRVECNGLKIRTLVYNAAYCHSGRAVRNSTFKN
jgi:hypothetical protein